MTGTPIANRPYDIWAQIYFLDQGKSLGSDFHLFKKQTDLSNKLATDNVLQNRFEREVSSIYERIQSFSVRETKSSGIIELPDKVFSRHEVDLSVEQRKLYDQIREELRVEVLQDNEYVLDDSSAMVKRLLRLVQIVSNPNLVDESFCGKSAKFAVLDELLQSILSQGEKCIVWSNFIENVEQLSRAYAEFGSVMIHGGMRMTERNQSVDKFRSEQYRVMFATPASAKEGLTLTMANHVIFYDRGFSLDDYLQAQDRIHRISQKKTCYVHNIIAKDSIDEWIDVLLDSKHRAAALAQGDITLKDYKAVADYTFGDMVKEILFPENEEDTYE